MKNEFLMKFQNYCMFLISVVKRIVLCANQLLHQVIKNLQGGGSDFWKYSCTIIFNIYWAGFLLCMVYRGWVSSRLVCGVQKEGDPRQLLHLPPEEAGSYATDPANRTPDQESQNWLIPETRGKHHQKHSKEWLPKHCKKTSKTLQKDIKKHLKKKTSTK